jgi:hypothetical protein
MMPCCDTGFRLASLGIAAVLACGSIGCGSGGPPAREDVLAIPAEEHYGGGVKSTLYELCAKMEKRGVKGAQDALPQVLENMQGYENQALGDHAETYRQIDNKLAELDNSLKSSPSVATIKQAVEELRALADKLPGKAEPHPVVE